MRWELNGVLVAAAHRRELDLVRPAAFAALSDAERRRVETLPDDRADDVVLGRHLLRTLAVEVLDGAGTVEGTRAVVVASPCHTCGREHGRPTFPDLPLVGSIAHAGGLVVVAIAHTSAAGAVGIDTEPHRSGGLDEAALRAWTRAEALAKLTGTGLVDPLPHPTGASTTASTNTANPANLYELPTPGWITTLAVANP